MDFKDDVWSWIEDSTTLDEQDEKTTYKKAGDILPEIL